MTVVRWKFTDPKTAEVYNHPISPNQMSTPWLGRQTQTMVQSGPGGAVSDGGALLAMQAPAVPTEWTFGGVIRTEQHYRDLLAWSKKDYPIVVTDHYSRSWNVIITTFEPEDRKPVPLAPWRSKYVMKTLMLSGS